jgi:hypothetical protein
MRRDRTDSMASTIFGDVGQANRGVRSECSRLGNDHYDGVVVGMRKGPADPGTGRRSDLSCDRMLAAMPSGVAWSSSGRQPAATRRSQQQTGGMREFSVDSARSTASVVTLPPELLVTMMQMSSPRPRDREDSTKPRINDAADVKVACPESPSPQIRSFGAKLSCWKTF